MIPSSSERTFGHHMGNKLVLLAIFYVSREASCCLSSALLINHRTSHLKDVCVALRSYDSL